MSLVYGAEMTRPRRVAPQTHLVLVDTNILFDEDKKHPVSPDFDKFWHAASSVIPLALRVPRVVIGELHFQQTTSALKLSSTIRDSLEKLTGVTQATYTAKLEEARIKGQVEKKLERWLKSLSGVIAETPFSTIDWPSLVDSAVWRTPPFSFDPKNKENEKGFRDALILETVAAVSKAAKTNEAVIFLTNDILLRTATERRLKGQKNFLAFESIPDFESYIQLTQQQLTDKFVKEIQAHARAKFYTANDDSSLYMRDKLSGRIRAEFKADLDTAPENELSAGMIGLLGPALSQGLRRASEKWWISSTRFERLVGDREFHWVTEISVAQLYDRIPSAAVASLLPQVTGPVKLRIVTFDIKWKANVKADGRFHDVAVQSIERTQTRTEEPTPEKLSRWQLTSNTTPA
jgi:PIN domain-containing protein